MARYIDIEGAGIGKANREQFLVPEFADGWNAVLKILDKEPTADVVEVKHGYWKTVTETKVNTVCGSNAKIQYKICSNCEKPMGLTGTDYCGWCGAKMDVSKMEITSEGVTQNENSEDS